MAFDAQGNWHPGTSPKQDYLRQICQQKKFVLAAGPRFSTKTIGCLHAFVEHGWLTPRGNDVIITISQTVGIDSGIWKDFVEVIIPQWIEGNFGLEWVRKPYIMGVSKKPTCEITNITSLDMDALTRDDPERLRAAGGTTIFQLESLKVEAEVEDRFKPRRFSGIYVPELSTFLQENTFTTWTECLRLLGLPSNKHLFLADTNPAPEGPASFIYKIWFELLNAEPASVSQEYKALRDNLGRVDFEIDDNTFDTPERIAELKSKYFHDEDLYARYIKGEWVTASEDALFYKVFRPSIHVVGELETPGNPEPELMVPQENCSELVTGWDPGVVNSAAVIMERAVTIIDKHPTSVLKYLDELVITGESHSLEDFTLQFLKLMEFWEKEIGRPGKTVWRHWSDRSVFDTQSPESGRYYHQIIYDASVQAVEDGLVNITEPVMLQAADRGPGSVLQRVDLWKRLLFDDRLLFSASKCPKLIQMNKSIRRGTSGISVIQKGSVYKHPFDAASYAAASECYDELNRAVMNHLFKTRRKGEGTLVSVAT